MNQGRYIPGVLLSFNSFTPSTEMGSWFILSLGISFASHSSSSTCKSHCDCACDERNCLKPAASNSYGTLWTLSPAHSYPPPLHLQHLLLLLLAHVYLLVLILHDGGSISGISAGSRFLSLAWEPTSINIHSFNNGEHLPLYLLLHTLAGLDGSWLCVKAWSHLCGFAHFQVHLYEQSVNIKSFGKQEI